ncbi:thiosulfate:glutathione sulfurtransferase-like [Clavelina lepadiformis]|uniref:thiosulfate:glutathione sulfurtransferase-like n=1 Tax=Clavelina lepadiformis TaxID=159417 RepID=UPI004042D7BD
MNSFKMLDAAIRPTRRIRPFSLVEVRKLFCCNQHGITSTSNVFHINASAPLTVCIKSAYTGNRLTQHSVYTTANCFSQWINIETGKEYTVSLEELRKLVDDDDDEVVLIDVRQPNEVAKGRVPCKRYVNIPVGAMFAALSMNDDDFKKEYGIEKPGKEDDIVFMCLGGVRSTWAFQVAQHFGFSKSKHYPGGWAEWSRS